jgi:hypothetical protein
MTALISGAPRARRGWGAGVRSTGAVQGSSSVQAMTSNEVIETGTRQLPPLPQRPHYVRCPVRVHELPEGTLGISYQGGLLARDDREGHVRRRRHCAAGAPRAHGSARERPDPCPRYRSSLLGPLDASLLRPCARWRGPQRHWPSAPQCTTAAPAAPPAVLHTQGRAILLRAREQLPTMWTGTHSTRNSLLPCRDRALAPSTMWTAACAIIQRPSYAREERLIRHQKRRRETAIEPSARRSGTETKDNGERREARREARTTHRATTGKNSCRQPARIVDAGHSPTFSTIN